MPRCDVFCALCPSRALPAQHPGSMHVYVQGWISFITAVCLLLVLHLVPAVAAVHIVLEWQLNLLHAVPDGCGTRGYHAHA